MVRRNPARAEELAVSPAEAANARRLMTPEGRKLYALRKQTPEPVCGIIKSERYSGGTDQCLVRAVKCAPRSQWNGGFSAHSGPSRGDRCRCASHQSRRSNNLFSIGSRPKSCAPWGTTAESLKSRSQVIKCWSLAVTFLPANGLRLLAISGLPAINLALDEMDGIDPLPPSPGTPEGALNLGKPPLAGWRAGARLAA
jgi:hypothetical protein